MKLAALTVLAAPRFTTLSPTSPPTVRRSSSGAVRGDELFIYGGFNSMGGQSDLHVYDAGTNAWSLIQDTFPARERHSMVFDPSSDRVVIVGGALSTTVTDSVFLIDGASRATSAPMLPTSRPSARIDSALHWVPSLGRFVLFGGRTSVLSSNFAGDLWLLSVADGGVTWSSPPPAGTPPSARGAPCTAWDTDHELLLLFGGEAGGSYSTETWQWAPDGGGWTNLTTMVNGTLPSGRGFCATEWEPRIKRLVLYGGQTQMGPTGGLYTFDPVALQWVLHAPVNAPGVLSDATAAYVASLGGIVVFGGRTGASTYVNSTLLLRMNEAPLVDAGPDLMTGEGVMAQLSGSAIDTDLLGQSIAVAWTQLSGPTVMFSDAGSLTPQVAIPRVTVASVIRLRLTVDDGIDIATDTVDLAVANSINEPTIPMAGPDQTVRSGDLVQLLGSGSDPNNDPISYLWTQDAGPVVLLSSTNVPSPAFVAPEVTTSTNLDFGFSAYDALGPATTLPVRVTVLPRPDAGTDAGTDAGSDAGFDGGSDAGFVDAGMDDAGFDAGELDAGELDAGVDAGTSDAGSVADAGIDGGVTVDGGPGTAATYDVACGCSTSGPGAFALLLLAALNRRRRRSPAR